MSFRKAINVGMSTWAFKLANAEEHHASNSFCRGVFFAEFSRNICATFASSLAAFETFFCPSLLLVFFLFLWDWFVLLLLRPGGGVPSSSQKPPPPLLGFTAELQGADELGRILEDAGPWWFCLDLACGVVGLVEFDVAVTTPIVAALFAHDKLELALPHTEA